MPSAYEAVEIRRKTRLSSGRAVRYQSCELAYGAGASVSEILKSARNSEAIWGLRDHLDEMKLSGVQNVTFVYLIEDIYEPDVVKVGQTYHPIQRYTSLQGGTWRDLRIGALFHPLSGKAVNLEGAVLERARQDGSIIRGEWLSLDLEGAARLVIEAAREMNVSICGADQYFKNLVRRVECMNAKLAA